MNDAPETHSNGTKAGSDRTPDHEFEYPTAGPGAAFVKNMSIQLMLFLWLIGLVPGAVLASAVSGDPDDVSSGEVPVGGLIVVGWGLAWTAFWIYFVVSRRLRRGNVTTIDVSPSGIAAVDHLGIGVTMLWDDVTSIGWVRLPSAGAGLAKAVKPVTRQDDASGKLNSADGLVGRATLTAPGKLPRRARKILAANPANADGLYEIGLAFLTAGRVDEANTLVSDVRKYRPDLLTDRTVREAR